MVLEFYGVVEKMVYNIRMKSTFFSIIVSILLITVSCVSVFNASSNPGTPIVETKYAEEKNGYIYLHGKIVDFGVEECDFIWIWFQYKQINNKLNTGIFLKIIIWILTILGLYSPDDGPNDNPDNPSDPNTPDGTSETTHMMLRSDRTDFVWAIEEQLEPGIYEFRACAKHTFGSTGYGEWVKFEVK